MRLFRFPWLLNLALVIFLPAFNVAAQTLNPSNVLFGSQTVGTSSSPRIVKLTNNLTVVLTISGISVSGDFVESSACPIAPNTLSVGASCNISVSFVPTAGGLRSGTLSVTDDAGNSPQTASLTGSGVWAAIPPSGAYLAPPSLSFPSQLLTTTSAAQTVALQNGQRVPLTISAIATTGDFAQTSNCPLFPNTLAAGSACIISVTFTPSALGTRTGILSVTDNASSNPQTTSLTGTGSLSGLETIFVTPPNPTVPVGDSQQLVATGNFQQGPPINMSSLVTWTSSAASIAQVGAGGLVQAISPGTATITASFGSVSGQTTVFVSPPVVTSIAVTPSAPDIPVGAYQQFTALLTYSDGSTKDGTSEVNWASSANAVATINSSGLATAASQGSSTISASSGAVTGSAVITITQPQCVVPPAGLVGWWTGDGNTVDIAGNNSGILQNGATYSAGEVAQAFTFTGNGASVLVNSAVYSPATGTVMFWFMPTGAGTITGSYAGGQNRAPGFSVDSNGNLNWEFGNLSAQSLGQVSPSQWYHVAMTYSTTDSGVNVNVYLNGTLVASSIANANTSWNPQLAIGAYLGAQAPSFTGSVDEFAIFNQVLTTQQIGQIYNAFSAGMCKPTLQSITVTPANASLAPGLSLQFDAAGAYSDNSTHDLTTSASWSTGDSTVATVNPSGLATALANGSTTVSAALGSASGSTGLTVAPSLVSVQVNPPNPSSAVGTTQQFTATGTFSDGSQQDLTASVSWSSSVPAVATLAPGGLATCLVVGQTTITATAGSVAGSTVLTVTAATLSSITVSPANPSIAAGTTQQFTATGTFSDGSQQDLTTSVSWSSSAPAAATINSVGLATALASGQTTITATSGSISKTATLTVTQAVLVSITVNPANSSLLVGGTQPFTATGTFSDNSQQDLTSMVTWASSNTAIATIDQTGLATALSVGSTSVSATLNSIIGSTTLNVILPPPTLVSISVSPANPTVAIGQNQQFTAQGTYSDGSNQNLTNSVLWNSSQAAVASISNTGLASGLSGGASAISATLGSIVGSANLNVNSLALVSIAVTPATPSIALGTNQQFAAVATYADGSTLDLTTSVSWSSSTTAVATINAAGLASSLSIGQSTIAAAAAGISGSAVLTVTSAALTSISVSPATPSIPLGTTAQFAATGTFTDGTTQDVTTSVQWASSDMSIATISNASGSQGLATSVAQGTTTISATSGAISGSATLTVNSAALVSITVNPATPSIALGTTQQFAATGTFTDGSQQDVTNSATWSSASTAVATVSPTGLATSVSVGTSLITATLASIQGSTLLTVTPAAVVSIVVNPSTAAVPVGINQAFTAQGTFTDGSVQDVTVSAHWSSSAPAVATVSNSPGTNGLATSLGSGSTMITATLTSVAGSANLTVTTAVLAAIQVAPVSPNVAPGGTIQFTATGIYTDGTSTNITGNVTWASSTPAVATVSNLAGSQGLASGIDVGTTRISAASGALETSTTLTVQDQLVAITITPSNAVITLGSNQQFAATATYASGVQNDITNTATWTSSNPAVATISSGGLAMSVAAGQVTITASVGAVTSSASLQVNSVPTPSFANLEPAQTNPIRLSADGTRLFAVNTPNNSLLVYDATQPANPVLLSEIPVGVGPVSANPRTQDEIWVVNQVSNSISVVSISQGIVTDTIYTGAGTEPMDVVFAGTNQAYVSCSRNNTIAVFDTGTHAAITVLPVFGGSPRALAVSATGGTVYAAFAISGNATTIIPAKLAPPQPPPTNKSLPPPPQVGLIVAANDPNWSSYVTFKMPDNDVVAITAGTTPTVAGYYSGVGTINLGLAVNPATNDLFVTNTDALNLTFFEPNLRGHWVNNRITRIQVASGQVTPFDLNPNINYSILPNPNALSTALAQPTGVVFDPSGNFMYVASFGTDRVAQVDTNGNVLSFVEVSLPSGSGPNADPKNKRGPRGLALNAAANTLYSLNRLSDTISVINTSQMTESSEITIATDPTPQAVKQGRGFLYDAKLSGNGTGSCASCHVDADMDHLAWNLGDPGGNMTQLIQNGKTFNFHPMKGPMTTQTMRGLQNLAPYHWRGDQPNFAAFNPTFDALMGGSQLSDADMATYTTFVNSIQFLPNPNQNLDRSLPTSLAGGNPVNGEAAFLNVRGTGAGVTCNSCHTSNPGPGTNLLVGLASPPQPMKVPHLRNIYQKQLYTRHNKSSIDGFGFEHDGTFSSLADFLAQAAFPGYTSQQRLDIAAFMLCFDTGTAPAVGFTITLTSANVSDVTEQSYWATLQSQAAGSNIDLIVRGTIQGQVTGLLYQPSQQLYSGSNNVQYTQSQLQNFIQNGDTMSFIGVPPGTGAP
jgi:uncharacterized protein YjdB